MKTITCNLITKIYLFILAMQEWSEQRWKEVVSPPISQLFAQARRDMEEGKPLPDLPPSIPQRKRELLSERLQTYLIGYAFICILTFMFCSIDSSPVGEQIIQLPTSSCWIFISLGNAFVAMLLCFVIDKIYPNNYLNFKDK